MRKAVFGAGNEMTNSCWIRRNSNVRDQFILPHTVEESQCILFYNDQGSYFCQQTYAFMHMADNLHVIG